MLQEQKNAGTVTKPKQGKQQEKSMLANAGKKAMVALVAALVTVLGLGITSFGDKGYVAETVKQLLGERKLTNIDTDHEGKEETINTSEENVYQT